MRAFVLAAAVAFMIGCAPAEETDIMSEGCDARGVSAWAAGEETFSIEAATVGPDCARAVATLVVRNSSGEPVFTDVHAVSDLMTLADVADPAAMQIALADWVDASDPAFANTSALPDWPANADAPTSGEFPFYPEGYTRETWLAMRASASPVFCYVQGMESMACIIHGDGGIERIGAQTFPG